MTNEEIGRIRALGSDGTFEGDLKVVIAAAAISGESPLSDLRGMTDRIVGLHEWHMQLLASQC